MNGTGASDRFPYLTSHYDRRPYDIEAIFKARGVARDTRISTAHAAGACAMVSEGLGVAIVASVAVHEYRTANLVIRPFQPRIDFPVFSHYPSRTMTADLATEFVGIVKQKLKCFAGTNPMVDCLPTDGS